MVSGRNSNSVDRAEVERFSAIAPQWWDENGAFRPLHRLNPARLAFVRDRFAAHFGRETKQRRPFAGLSLLDIGCGGGLMCEPLARLGFTVTGIDADEAARNVARRHAKEQRLAIDYRAESIEDLAAGARRFDAVLALEVVEHTADPTQFMVLAGQLVRPGGALIASTLNRTPQAYLLAIVGAEYVLRWLPRGTHRWDKFVTPDELEIAIEQSGLHITGESGVIYNLLADRWQLSRDTDVNYMVVAEKPRA